MNQKKISLLRLALPACALAAAGCLFSGKDAAPPQPSGALSQARLSLRPAALAKALPKGAAGSAAAAGTAASIDSVSVRVTGDDMAPLELGFSGDSLVLTLEALPPGANRTVEAALFRAGRLLYLGKTVCDLKKEERLDVTVRCEPQFSRVYARFHIPLGQPARATQGGLTLSSTAGRWSVPLRIDGEFGSFLLDELPGDARYDLEVTLSDSSGKDLYQGDRAGLYLPLGEEAHWDLPLLPTQAEAGVGLTLVDPARVDVTAGFPARKRAPGRPGEAVVTELYAAPSTQDSSSEGEWWELFNRTADTLSLRGCRLSRDRLGGVTRSYAFDSLQALPPGAALVFGRGAARADVHYKDFSLVNTSSSMLLLCAGDSLVVDSMRYSAVPADSAVAAMIRDGKVTTLDVGALGRGAAPSSWCLTSQDPARAGTPGFASPGAVGACPVR